MIFLIFTPRAAHSIIKEFFDKKLRALLKEPTGNTGISYYEVSKEGILNNENTVNLKNTALCASISI